jgi:hypothetical protein
MTPKEISNVVLHFDLGGKVERKMRIGVHAAWVACHVPSWDFFGFDYRAKAEPTFRPYTDSELDDLVGATVERIDGKAVYLITASISGTVYMGNGPIAPEFGFSAQDLLEEFESYTCGGKLGEEVIHGN